MLKGVFIKSLQTNGPGIHFESWILAYGFQTSLVKTHENQWCLTSGRAAGGVVRKDDAACRELQSRRAQKATRDRRERQEQILGPASARAMVFSTQLAGRFASLVTPVW